MRIMIDLNVIIDIVTERREFYKDSSTVYDQALKGLHSGFLCAHMVTTTAYLAMRHAGSEALDPALDLVLAPKITVIPCDRKILLAARKLGFADFKDAVVAASAEKAKCQYIITRNPRDFARSPIPALTPAEFLTL